MLDEQCEKKGGRVVVHWAWKNRLHHRETIRITAFCLFFPPDFSILTQYLICAGESAATNTEAEEALESLSRRTHWRLQPFVSLFLPLPRLPPSLHPSPLAFISLFRLTRCSAFRSHDCSRQRANCVDDPWLWQTPRSKLKFQNAPWRWPRLRQDFIKPSNFRKIRRAKWPSYIALILTLLNFLFNFFR